MTIVIINPTPTPILFFRKLFIFNILVLVFLLLLLIPLNLKIDVKSIITPLSLFYLNNIVSGSILCEHLPASHSAWLHPLSDRRVNIPFLLIKFFFYSPFSALDSKCEREVTRNEIFKSAIHFISLK